MYNKFFSKPVFLLAVVLLFYSCDKDYNVIGSDVIGDNHFDHEKETFEVTAYNQKIGPIQSDNMGVNGLGIYDNPVFGTTNANYATQVLLSKVAPVIGKNPVVVGVVLSIPYFSKLKSTETSGENIYTLDSIYGAKTGKIKLSVYESGYVMGDKDPLTGFQDNQKFYSNQNSDFVKFQVGARLNDSLVDSQNDVFFFDSKEFVDVSKDEDGKEKTTRVKPGMRLSLNKAVFENKILKAASGNLVSNSAFKNYFKGLYFKVEKSGNNPSNLAMLDFAKGKITIKYKEDIVPAKVGDPVRVLKTLVLDLADGISRSPQSPKTGNTVSLLEQSNTVAEYAQAIASANPISGDKKLYLKGGEGALTVVNLFSKPGVLDNLRKYKDKWLVNEANLVFHIDGASMINGVEPQRIYLYDLTNNIPLVDYKDATSGTNPKNGKVIYDGNIKKESGANGRGITYKFRITQHIKNLIRYADSTNVKLGLVVTEDINDAVSYKFKTATTTVSQAPRASVMSPLGTVLFGSNFVSGDADYDKRIKLEIFYTKPN
jgi:hypothetical protein